MGPPGSLGSSRTARSSSALAAALARFSGAVSTSRWSRASSRRSSVAVTRASHSGARTGEANLRVQEAAHVRGSFLEGVAAAARFVDEEECLLRALGGRSDEAEDEGVLVRSGGCFRDVANAPDLADGCPEIHHRLAEEGTAGRRRPARHNMANMPPPASGAKFMS